MTMRPWLHKTPPIALSDQWFMGDYSWRRSCNAPVLVRGPHAPCRTLPLCFAVKRKLLNLFAEIDAEDTGFVTEAQAMRAFSAGLEFVRPAASTGACLADEQQRLDHEAVVSDWWRIVCALRRDVLPAATGEGLMPRNSSTAFSSDDTASSGAGSSQDGSASPGRDRALNRVLSDTRAALSKEEWLLAFQQVFSSEAAVSAEDIPEWMVRPSISRFRLAKKATKGQLTAKEWEEWQVAAHTLSCEELSQRTRIGPTGGGDHATLRDIFIAADDGGKGVIVEVEFACILRRWWRVTEHWCELNSYSLP